MLTLQLAACIGMIMGCFILFEISLEDFTADLFGLSLIHISEPTRPEP